ncbi:MAG TPA: hypothetical protein VIT45_17795 [Allosphingosinicella sp.]
MAQPLSFFFNVHAADDDAAQEAGQGLVQALTSGAGEHPLPNILHYLWAISMPDQVDQPAGTKAMLLNTVYDEDFDKYVKDIARGAPQLFDIILSKIVGMEHMVPVLSHLDEFAAFILAHDLAQGGKIPTFKQNYDYSTLAIWRGMGG